MRDLRYAARMLFRSRAFTVAAVLCLALGIGATSAIFSVVNAVVLRPLPYKEPDKLVRVYTEFRGRNGQGLFRFWTSPPEFLELRRDLKSWEGLEAWVTGGANMGGGKEPVRVTAGFLSGGMLSMLGVPPLHGRLPNAEDDKPGAPQTAVLSYGTWQRVFGGDMGVLSREVKLNGQSCTVVGIMPDGFQFPPGETTPPEIWTLLQLDPARPGSRGSHYLYLLGRLKPGTTHELAKQEMERLVKATGETAGPGNHQLHPVNHPLVSFPFHEEVVGNVRPAMFTMLAAVVFVLLIACGNVANLLLARAEGRQKEISVRTAMGASFPMLLRQFLTEGLLLSLFGAVLGLVLAFGGLRLITIMGPGSIPRANEITIDWRVLLFTLGVSIATGVFFGTAPLLHRFGRTVAEALKAADGRTTASVAANRFRRFMVAGELALALVLLIGAGLMIKAFWKLQGVDIGMRTDHLLTMRIALPQQVYPESQRVVQFWEQVLQRVNALPGVESATMVSGTPPIRRINANDTQIEGFVATPDGPPQNIAYYQTGGDRLLETAGLRLIEGRMFGPTDGPDSPPVLVVNQTLARTYWPGQSPIGKRMRPSLQNSPWFTIVGVVGDVKNAGVDKPVATELFLPFRQGRAYGIRGGMLMVRTKGDPMSMARAVRAEVAAVDGSLPVEQIRTMEDIVSSANARPRFLTVLLGLFSATALLLAALGIYGVMSYLVAQRTAEFGIRMAIGAQQGDVLWLVLRQGLVMALVGVVTGVAGALALTRLLKQFLFGVDAVDPLTFAAMAFTLGATVLVACIFPARRATQVDPMRALRYE
ncbi:MAG: ABC transporter permease [Acidobacteria bacterium]|nr:ABC transporter permease [Acidobacteriota bacterium]